MFLVAALSLLVIGLVYPELMNSDIPSTVANIGGWKSGGWGVGGGGVWGGGGWGGVSCDSLCSPGVPDIDSHLSTDPGVLTVVVFKLG